LAHRTTSDAARSPTLAQSRRAAADRPTNDEAGEIGVCGQADAGKQMPSQLVSFTAIHAIDVNRRLDDILDGGEMLE